MTESKAGPARVLGVATSPRLGGNSETLLDAVLDGAREAGAETTTIRLAEMNVGGCRECGGCDRTGRCVVQDDMQGVYGLLSDHNRLVFATPIYFLNICAQGKAMIDRGQAPWVNQVRLKRPFCETPKEQRRGLLVACGGLNARDLFACAERCYRSFLTVIDMQYAGGVLVPSVDRIREINEHATALSEAREAGVALAGPPVG